MRATIEIRIDELKDGSLVVKYNGTELGDIDINPIDQMNEVSDLIKIRDKLVSFSQLRNNLNCEVINKLLNDLNEEIEHRLAKLLAWYYTEY